MISQLIKNQKDRLTENWPKMVHDAGEAHALHHLFDPNANAAVAARLWLERSTMASAVTHKLATHRNHVIDVDVPTPRPDLDRTDSVTLKIGTYEPIDLALHEFQQLEACLHNARMAIETHSSPL